MQKMDNKINKTPPAQSAITLVTAYFQLDEDGRKRSAGTYHDWMANFLPFIRWPRVVFCDAQSVEVIKRLRAGRPARYCVTSLDEFFVARHRDILHAHFRQRKPHLNPDISLLYHERANFVRRAIDADYFGSELFFWCDIGILRHINGLALLRFSERIEWPNLEVCRAAFADRVGFFAFTQTFPFWVGGGFWGGAAQPTRRFAQDVYDSLERCIRAHAPAIRNGHAVPKGQGFPLDETIFHRMLAQAEVQPAARIFVLSNDVPCFRLLKPLKTLPAAFFPFFIILYLLNGGRFPWAYLGREISLTAAARLALAWAARRCRRKLLR